MVQGPQNILVEHTNSYELRLILRLNTQIHTIDSAGTRKSSETQISTS